jgi:cytochrome c553
LKPFAVLLICALASVSAWAKGSESHQGALLFETCKACHGPHGEGNSAIKAPAIAGLPEWYLLSTLNKFKHGVRGAHPDDKTGLQMRPMARQLLDDESVKLVAAEVSALPVQHPLPTLHGDVEVGKTLYVTCMACHGPKGEGNLALKAPPIGRLPDWYIVEQLEKFKSGIRGAHPKDAEGAQMAPMAKLLVDRAAMENVASYIVTLQDGESHSTTKSATTQSAH